MSNQISLLVVEDSPAMQTAKELIRGYVKRGDAPASLATLGAWCSWGRASVGGYAGIKRVGNDKVLVTRDINGKDCEEIFDLIIVYNKVKEEL